MKNLKIVIGLVVFTVLVIGLYQFTEMQRASAQTQDKRASLSQFDALVRNNSERMIREGNRYFASKPSTIRRSGVTRLDSMKRSKERSLEGWVPG
jgi:Tfp pilus assembly protein PilX